MSVRAPARKLALSSSVFERILTDVRDSLLHRMRTDGFYSALPNKRYDATVWDLNNGLCDAFAYEVAKAVAAHVRRPGDPRWPRSYERIADTDANVDVVVLADQFQDYDGGDHVVVRRDGRLYDAECIGGVRRWRDLPIVQNSGLTREQAISYGKRC